ncbi:MAG: LysR substrate-binding domain-containing protein [Pseudomonadota bacterium]
MASPGEHRKMRLPSTDSLITFERAAKNLNFKKAAKELNMTPSAVSQQIAKLEASLGVELFSRNSKGVSVTEAGEVYIKEVHKALALLRTATRHAVETSKQQPIKIATYTPFSTYWLFPRVNELYEQDPTLSLDIESVTRQVDVTLRDADVMIEFGPLERAQEDGHLPLFPRTSRPLCSPEFLERHGPLQTVDDLRHVPLLHNLATEDEWLDWFAAAEGAADPPPAQHRFRDRGSCLSAAEKGLGVALGCTHLVQHDLREGKLITPFDTTVAYEEGYYVRISGAANRIQRVDKLLAWFRVKSQEVCGAMSDLK